MRSVNAPRVPHDATVEIGKGGRARAVNLSTGGIFVEADQPLDPGSQVQLKVSMRDGAAPLDVNAEVVWREDGGMALRFVELDDVARRRIQRLVQKREPTYFGKRDVRIHLPALPAPLRACARDLTERGVMIEAELPWLRLGSQVTTELSSDRACDGRVQWIGLDVTRSGAARLRIFVDLTEETPDGLTPPPGPIPVADDAMQIIGEERRAPSPRRWLWPSLALGGFIASGVLSVALLSAHPTLPLLLPTAPPEREGAALHLPTRVTVPDEKPESEAAAATPAAPATVTQPTAAPAKPAHAKPTRASKKRARRLTPRAG